VWFAEHTGEEVAAALAGTSILWERYRSFAEASVDPKVTDNPLFTRLDQPRIGAHLAPGLPLIIDGRHAPAVPAPALGDDTATVLTEGLAMTAEEVAGLTVRGTVAGPCDDEAR
jgi:2-methylfumaryl-CoA isomerase